MNSTILVVDDEPQIRKFLSISLSASGYRVIEAETAAQGIAAALDAKPDLIILDLGLPDQSGQEVISAVRERQTIPIIVLSVRAQEYDKVEALDRGANDYVVKPFGIAELMARIRVMLRTASVTETTSSALILDDLCIDLDRGIVTRSGSEVRLSKKEWALLALLAAKPDHVITHKTLLRDVWGPAHVEDTVYLRVYINQLRQKLETDPTNPKWIVTEPGIGYRLKRAES